MFVGTLVTNDEHWVVLGLENPLRAHQKRDNGIAIPMLGGGGWGVAW